MGLTQTLFGTTRTIPVTKERNWGAQGTSILSDLMYANDSLFTLVGTQGIICPVPVVETLAASGTITPASPVHRISGSGGPVTLDGTTAINDGTKDGQRLRLEGNHATDTVTVPDAANTELNGICTLDLGEMLDLEWNAARSLWVEVSRSN